MYWLFLRWGVGPGGLGLAVWLVGSSVVAGQGLVGGAPKASWLETSGQTQVRSARVQLDNPFPTSASYLECQFGFATQERFADDQLFDAVNGVLLDSTGRRLTALFTISSSGLSFLPQTPDSLTVDPARAALESVAAPAAVTEFETRFAFRLHAPLPTGFAPGPVELALVLYDNLDDLRSVAWVEQAVIVPEPSGLAGAVLLISAGCLVFRSRCR